MRWLSPLCSSGPACLIDNACRHRLLVARLFRDRRVSRVCCAQENEQAFPKLGSLGLPGRICQPAFSTASTNVSRSEIAVMRKLLGQEWSFMFAKQENQALNCRPVRGISLPLHDGNVARPSQGSGILFKNAVGCRTPGAVARFSVSSE